jgi:hypothetical protein
LNPGQKDAPTVALSLSGLDASKDANLRVGLEALNMTGEGFDLRVTTWADTELYMVNVSWVAYHFDVPETLDIPLTSPAAT